MTNGVHIMNILIMAFYDAEHKFTNKLQIEFTHLQEGGEI